uniref:Uncharacterized protein n=1 Tax=Agrobacterium albertimagni TaxID=147266 RepID=A0A7C1T190_9HYPH
MTTIAVGSLERSVRRRHPNKDIEQALRYAEAEGWRVEVGGSHAWGRIYCPYDDETCRCGEFCITSIWSTPANATNHARAIRRVVERCSRRADEGES